MKNNIFHQKLIRIKGEGKFYKGKLMISSFIRKIIGSRNERELKRLQPYVDMINRLEPEIQKLSNEDLRAKTIEFKERFNNAVSNLNPDILSEGQKEEVMENTLNELLPEAFAVVREVAKRTLNMRHFDVQLIGGIALHEGKIARQDALQDHGRAVVDHFHLVALLQELGRQMRTRLASANDQHEHG